MLLHRQPEPYRLWEALITVNQARTNTADTANTGMPGQGRSIGQYWLYLFIVIVVFSAAASITTYYGDQKVESNAKSLERFTQGWISWRSIEDSIRSSLDQIGIQLASDFELSGKQASVQQIRSTFEQIHRCVRGLQEFRIPPIGANEVAAIYQSLFELSDAADSLEPAHLRLASPHAGLPSSMTAEHYRRWEGHFTALVRALNNVRSERLNIVVRYTDESNAEFMRWRSIKKIVNSVSLVVVVLVAILGLFLARTLSRSEHERSRQFALLSESEDRFRTVVANIPGVIFRSRIADDWPVVYISDNVKRITGYPASDFFGNQVRSFGSIIHPADTGRRTAALETSLRSGTSYGLEYRIVGADGRIVWLSERGRAVTGYDGQGQWLDGAIFDITDRRKAMDNLAESEARLEAILRSAGDGIIVMDGECRVQLFNEAAQSVFGRSAAITIDGSIDEFVPGFSDRPLPGRGERMSFETVGIHSEQGEFPLQLSLSRVSVGGADSYAIIVRDLADEYDRRERVMESDKLTSIGTLAAGIAHEFKNYLAGIIGNASFALDSLQEPDGMEGAKDAFEQIITIGERANEIASSLLTYSRRPQDDLELLDIWEVISSTLCFTSKELAQKKIEIITCIESTPKVFVSANRAQQAFLNLIINASQAIINGGAITIAVKHAGNMVNVNIGDTGVGISPENIRRIFDPFFSTKGVWGKDAVHGTGLGLSVCRNIINSFGGEITVESVVGRGTTFKVSLPVADPQTSSVANSRSAAFP